MVFESNVDHCSGASGLRGLAPSPFWSDFSNGRSEGKQFIVRENGDGSDQEHVFELATAVSYKKCLLLLVTVTRIH